MPLPLQPLLLWLTSIGQLYKSRCVRAIEKTISITISRTITTNSNNINKKQVFSQQTDAHQLLYHINHTPLSNTISPTSDKMRPSTVFSVLAVAVYSSPLPRQNDPLSGLLGLAGLNSLTGSLGLGGLTGSLTNLPVLTPLGSLTDTLFSTVGQLLSPLGLLSPILVPSTLPCGLDAGFCVNTCSAECTGSSKKCSDCLLTCYKQSCANGQCNGTTPNAPNHVVADGATE
ncbi:hypothetical protein F4860DRAFT_510231 [Xylaria cubensis]|nr:hypothetical protein F4860DRAFT_510231 [Xylaria cubensis]